LHWDYYDFDGDRARHNNCEIFITLNKAVYPNFVFLNKFTTFLHWMGISELLFLHWMGLYQFLWAAFSSQCVEQNCAPGQQETAKLTNRMLVRLSS